MLSCRGADRLRLEFNVILLDIDDFGDAAKLFSSALIYTAELSTIIKAMNVACHANEKSFVMHSDSESALRKYE